MQEFQLIFNPGKGSVTLSRITAVVGDRVGAMPKPTRKGYIFVGWYMAADGNADSPDARKITAETQLNEDLFVGGPADTVLYARWKKPASAEETGKKNSLRTQKRAIAVLLVLSTVLAVTLGVVSVISDIYTYPDKDGIEYGFSYTVKFYAPTGKSGFYVVNLTADDAAGDGQTFDLPNGVTGGYTGEIYCGGVTLIFEGGILMGVK